MKAAIAAQVEAIHDPKERILKHIKEPRPIPTMKGSNPRSERADIETEVVPLCYGARPGSNPRSERADIETIASRRTQYKFEEAIHDPKERILKPCYFLGTTAPDLGSNPRSERADIETCSVLPASRPLHNRSNPRSERADIETPKNDLLRVAGKGKQSTIRKSGY